jgi:hypothetical protein
VILTLLQLPLQVLQQLSQLVATVTTVTKQKTNKRDRELSYVESSNILNATDKRNKRQ